MLYLKPAEGEVDCLGQNVVLDEAIIVIREPYLLGHPCNLVFLQEPVISCNSEEHAAFVDKQHVECCVIKHVLDLVALSVEYINYRLHLRVQ